MRASLPHEHSSLRERIGAPFIEREWCVSKGYRSEQGLSPAQTTERGRRSDAVILACIAHINTRAIAVAISKVIALVISATVVTISHGLFSRNKQAFRTLIGAGAFQEVLHVAFAACTYSPSTYHDSHERANGLYWCGQFDLSHAYSPCVRSPPHEVTRE